MNPLRSGRVSVTSRLVVGAVFTFALAAAWTPGEAVAVCFGGDPVRVFVGVSTLTSTSATPSYDSLTADPDCRTLATISSTSTGGGGSATASATGDLQAGTVEASSDAGPVNLGAAGAQGIISDRLHFTIPGAAPGAETDITVTLTVSGTEGSTGQFFTLSNDTKLLVGVASVEHNADEQLTPTVTDSVDAGWVSSQILGSTTTSFVFQGVYALHGPTDTADFNLHLQISCGNGASCDYTATLGLDLPAGMGITYTSNSGVALTPPPPLVITSINGGVAPTVNVPFDVVVQAQDGTVAANPLSVSADTHVALSRKLGTGAGTLGGTPGCTIASGASACTVAGVTYSNAESAVVLTATRTSGDDLSPGDSAPFAVKPVAPASKCRGAIVTGSATLVQAEAKAIRACAGKIVSGKLPASTTCRTETKTAGTIAKAKAKLVSAVAKACGGKDKRCGVGGDDVSLADAGWQIGACPSIEGGACTNAISDCTDIATCLTCIDEAAVDQAITLYYGALTPTDPTDKTQKALNKCQATIGSATTSFLAAKASALAKCSQAVNTGKATGVCPSADGKAVGAIAKAEAKKVAAICKACGGTDKACGGGDDSTPIQIGFAASCPAVTPPGAASCGRAITTLQDIVTCVDCVTEFKVDCTTLAATPGLEAYPTGCGP